MHRGEVWWARLAPPAGTRPVVLLSREKAIQVRHWVTVAQVTRTVKGLPTEVSLGLEDGMPKECVANTDMLLTIPKAALTDRICALSWQKMREVGLAVKFTLDLD